MQSRLHVGHLLGIFRCAEQPKTFGVNEKAKPGHRAGLVFQCFLVRLLPLRWTGAPVLDVLPPGSFVQQVGCKRRMLTVGLHQRHRQRVTEEIHCWREVLDGRP